MKVKSDKIRKENLVEVPGEENLVTWKVKEKSVKS